MLFTKIILAFIAFIGCLAAASPVLNDSLEGSPEAPTKSLRQVTRKQLVARSRKSPTVGRRAAPSPTPAPNSITSAQNGVIYNRFYSGSGFTMTDSNPGNTEGAEQLTIVGTTGQTEAIQQCANFADTSAGGGDWYVSFQIYYDDGVGNWICRIYYDDNTDSASYFNVANSNANPVFGYSA
ncbi:hypothetical protein IAU59_004322 [Kwoniella sp. CBS 9459]